MKKSLFAAAVLAAAGCCTAAAKAAELPRDFMGVQLGEPFEMAECASKTSYGLTTYVFEHDQPVKPCWRHTFGDPGTPLDVSDAEVQFYPARESSPAGVSFSRVLIVNGRAEGVSASTNGVTGQESILAALMRKYGTPAKLQDEEVQNRMGATFTSYTAAWGDPALQVSFYGVAGRIDSGLISVRTAIGQAHEEAKERAREAAAPSF